VQTHKINVYANTCLAWLIDASVKIDMKVHTTCLTEGDPFSIVRVILI